MRKKTMVINRKEVERIGIDIPNAKSKIGKENARLFHLYQLSIEQANNHIASSSSYEISQFTNCIDHWLEDQKMPCPETYYEEGAILYCDLGAYNFGYELCFPHPVVVLSQTRYFVEIIPCSSKKYGLKYSDVIDGEIQDGFACQTGLILYGKRWISKSRIIAQIGQTTPQVLKKIEESNLQFQPHLKEKIRQLELTNCQLKKQIEKLKKELNNKN